MGSYWGLLRNTAEHPIRTNYDSSSYDSSELVSHQKSSGLRVEITRNIWPFLQLTVSRADDMMQYFATLARSDSVFQLCFDSKADLQLKASGLIGPVVTKWHTIINRNKEVYSQIESIYNSRFFNMCFKVISPSFHASNLIYVLNYWRSFGCLYFGVEAVGMDNEIGVSFVSRVENKNGSCTFSLRRFNLAILSFYRRINKVLEAGVEVRRSAAHSSAALGIRARNYRSDVRLTVDHRRNVGFSWEERLSEHLTMNFNTSVDIDGLEYGIGFTFQS